MLKIYKNFFLNIQRNKKFIRNKDIQIMFQYYHKLERMIIAWILKIRKRKWMRKTIIFIKKSYLTFKSKIQTPKSKQHPYSEGQNELFGILIKNGEKWEMLFLENIALEEHPYKRGSFISFDVR